MPDPMPQTHGAGGPSAPPTGALPAQAPVTPVEPSAPYEEMTYGPEPAYPWPLAVGWVLFAIWAVFYFSRWIIPSYRAWSKG